MASETLLTPSKSGIVETSGNHPKIDNGDQVDEKPCGEARSLKPTSTLPSNNVCDNQQRLEDSLERSNTDNDDKAPDRPAEVSTESKPPCHIGNSSGDKQQGLGDSLEGLTKNQLRKLKKHQMWEQKKQYRL